jgi:hypothetical protein
MNYSKVTHVFSLSLLITLLMSMALSAQQLPGQQDQPVKEDFSDAEIE